MSEKNTLNSSIQLVVKPSCGACELVLVRYHYSFGIDTAGVTGHRVRLENTFVVNISLGIDSPGTSVLVC